MLPIPNLIVIYTFIVMGVGFAIAIYRVIKQEGSLWGDPSINPFLFYSGKVTMFICWGLTLLKAIFPDFGGVVVPLWISWPGACLLCIGTVVLLLSFYGLGPSLRYGLPEKETRLKTSGLYRFSRHPLYMGVFLVTFSCMIFFPNILNISVGLYCIAMQYLMIAGEEKFLAERFGTEWEVYKNKVRRFL
ncbi:MAG: isoprenylcysteine carboxylmethyltransferase family protein [Bacteroidales bacterium]|nr:isoprenylcysteine carboxylmethyltransferase family protein [Bacteroidales bacterium]